MRVIAGKYRSRRLQSLPGMNLRPTSDRLRETLFDVLTAGNPSVLEGTIWIDLYAGTGAVGIEALSRGASMVYFVDNSAKATELIRKNIRSLEIDGKFEIQRNDSLRALREFDHRRIQVDFVFLDPPYRLEQAYHQSLKALSDSSLLKAGGTVIAEHTRKFDPGENFGRLKRSRKLEQGDAVLSFYQMAG